MTMLVWYFLLNMALNSFLEATTINFDQLGLETLALTPLEQELSDLAHKQSLKSLQKFGIQISDSDEQASNHLDHVRVKRGRSNTNPGYYALPIPPLPSDINEDSTRLFTRPNKR